MVPFPPPPVSPRLDDGQGLEHLVTLHARSIRTFSRARRSIKFEFSFLFSVREWA